MTFKLMKHGPNQHGYGVSLTKYADGADPLSLETGFVLKCFPTQAEQEKYFVELSEITGFEADAHL